jgi:ParB family chromosome partitioning protein
MNISRKNMSARAVAAADQAPTINDRLNHARDLVAMHPTASMSNDSPTTARRGFDQAETVGAEKGEGRGEYAEIPLELIDPNPYNARRVYRPERVREMMASIAAHGQEVPGMATIRNGRYVLASAHYRLQAHRGLGSKTMKLMIRQNMTDRELYESSYRENAERESQTPVDNALAWDVLLKEGVYSNETEIADATKQSLSNINKTLSVIRLSAPTLEFVKENASAFGLSVLYELVLLDKAAGTEKALALAKMVVAGDAGRKEIAEARTTIELPRKRKEKETSRQYKIKDGDQKVGTLKDWDSGKVVLEVVLTDKAARAALVSELRERFNLVD